MALLGLCLSLSPLKSPRKKREKTIWPGIMLSFVRTTIRDWTAGGEDNCSWTEPLTFLTTHLSRPRSMRLFRSPQEMFMSPLKNVTPMDSQNASQNTYVSLAHTNPLQFSNANSPVPASTYSGSPAPSDFSLPLRALHPHAESQSHPVLETLARRCKEC
jgi:hypothetical protein